MQILKKIVSFYIKPLFTQEFCMYARRKIMRIILLRSLEEPLRRLGIVFKAVKVNLSFLQIKPGIIRVKLERLIN